MCSRGPYQIGSTPRLPQRWNGKSLRCENQSSNISHQTINKISHVWRRYIFLDGGWKGVWRRGRERHVEVSVVLIVALQGSVVVWARVSVDARTDLVIIDGNLNVQRYSNEMLTDRVSQNLASLLVRQTWLEPTNEPR